MKYFSFLLLFIFSFCHSVFALTSTDRIAIENIISDYTKSWNLNAGRGFADNFTEDADFVNIFADHYKSKPEIAQRHIDILNSFLKDSKLIISNIALRDVMPNVIVAQVKWTIDGFRTPNTPSSDAGQHRQGIFTQIFIHKDKKWLITASQNTMVP